MGRPQLLCYGFAVDHVAANDLHCPRKDKGSCSLDLTVQSHLCHARIMILNCLTLGVIIRVNDRSVPPVEV